MLYPAGHQDWPKICECSSGEMVLDWEKAVKEMEAEIAQLEEDVAELRTNTDESLTNRLSHLQAEHDRTKNSLAERRKQILQQAREIEAQDQVISEFNATVGVLGERVEDQAEALSDHMDLIAQQQQKLRAKDAALDHAESKTDSMTAGMVVLGVVLLGAGALALRLYRKKPTVVLAPTLSLNPDALGTTTTDVVLGRTVGSEGGSWNKNEWMNEKSGGARPQTGVPLPGYSGSPPREPEARDTTSTQRSDAPMVSQAMPGCGPASPESPPV